MRERVIWVVIVVIAATSGFFVGRQNGISIGEQNVQQAAAQFGADRGGFFAGNRGANGGAGGTGQNGPGRRGQNLIGTVATLDGQSIVIQTPAGEQMTIQLQTNATIRKQVDGTMSDIHTGDRIVALGTLNGSVFQATSVQIGVGGVPNRANG